METVLSKTGIEVCYPCIVHLLHNGENFECEYKSDHTGRDMVEYICKIQNIRDTRIWGLKFMDTGCMDEQRYWLDLNKLIRPQVKHLFPIRFYFRVKVYPPEPYKIRDQAIRHPIFQQLRLDLLSGRLFCHVNDAAMLVALILQHVHGNYIKELVWMYITYTKEKILRRERCSIEFFKATQKRALEIYERLLIGLTKLEIEDMFLRLASKLESYGVEPYLVKNIDKQEIILWMNYNGLSVYNKKRKTFMFAWNDISKITHEYKALFVHLRSRAVIVFECVNFSECNYIWSVAMDHLLFFNTTPSYTNARVGADYNFFTDFNDNISQMSSFFGSCYTEYNCSRFDDEELDNQTNKCKLKISNSLLRLIDFNSWKSQLSVFYALLVLYVMGTHTTIFSELPCVYSIKEAVNNFVSNYFYNKMITF